MQAIFSENLQIGTRLTVCFVLMSTLAIGLVGVSSYLAAINNDVNTILKNDHAKVEFAEKMRLAMVSQAIAVRNVILLSDTSAIQQEVDNIGEQGDQYEKAEKDLTKLTDSETEQKLVSAIQSHKSAAASLVRSVVNTGSALSNKQANELLMNEVRPMQQKWLAALDALIAHEKAVIEKRAETINGSYKHTRALLFVIGGTVLALGAFVTFLIIRSNVMRKRRVKAVKIAELIAAGDLTTSIEVAGEDDSSIVRAIKTMNDKLLRLVREVRASSNTITVAVKEIAVGNSDLSQRTEEQASSLEETASSMEELISTVKQNADNSKQANHLASSASQVAIKGGDIVGKVVVTMDLIHGSSKKIVDIISVIEGIAFQTNILSLNAAVEAARAGEQGRGFAVVAGEVRNLAQRSAAAAKEIKALIDDSVGKVSDGTKLVEEAGRTMDDIVVSVKKVNDIIAEIAAASEEQTSGIEQVNQAILQMDEVTQQNAALVEEASASAAALEEQATNLNMAISLFKLGGAEQIQPVSPHYNGAEAAPVGNKKRKLPATRKPGSPAAGRTPVRPVKVAGPNGDWREF